MTVFLLCAGEGTRLRPHTLTTPKPALPFLTVPLAAHAFRWTATLRPDRLVVNTFHLPAQVHQLFHALRGLPPVFFSDEKTLMDSGGGVASARSCIGDDDFLVVNGDEVFFPDRTEDLTEAYHRHRNRGAVATLMVMDYPGVGTEFGGAWTDSAGSLMGFAKKPMPGAVKGWHYIGAVFLSQKVFHYLPTDRPSNLLYDGLIAAMKDGQTVDLFPVTGWWRETGSEVKYLEATADAMDLLAAPVASSRQRFLQETLDLFSPGHRYRHGDGRRVLLAAGAQAPEHWEGFLVMGRDSRCREGIAISDTVAGDRVCLTGSRHRSLVLSSD